MENEFATPQTYSITGKSTEHFRINVRATLSTIIDKNVKLKSSECQRIFRTPLIETQKIQRKFNIDFMSLLDISFI